jgi:hypothetical protein
MAKTDKAESLIKARCIQRFSYEGKAYSVNEIYTGSSENVETLKANGLVDPHKDAVAYAEGLK